MLEDFEKALFREDFKKQSHSSIWKHYFVTGNNQINKNSSNPDKSKINFLLNLKVSKICCDQNAPLDYVFFFTL